MATKTNDSLLIRFRGLRQMTKEEAEKLRNEVRVLIPSVHEHTLFDEIFAPDPLTGNPNSELYVRLQGNPDIRDYIDKYMAQQISVPKVGEEDAELALDLQKSRFESANEYLDRVRKIQGLTNI